MLQRGQSCFSVSLHLLSLHVLFLRATGSTCQVVLEARCRYGMAVHPAAASKLAYQETAMLLVTVQSLLRDSEGAAACPLVLLSAVARAVLLAEKCHVSYDVLPCTC